MSPAAIQTSAQAEQYLQDVIVSEQALEAEALDEGMRDYHEDGIEITHFQFGLLYPTEEDGVETESTDGTSIKIERAHNTNAIRITYYGEDPDEEGSPKIISSAAMYKTRHGETTFQSRVTDHEVVKGDAAEQAFTELARQFAAAYAAIKRAET